MNDADNPATERASAERKCDARRFAGEGESQFAHPTQVESTSLAIMIFGVSFRLNALDKSEFRRLCSSNSLVDVMNDFSGAIAGCFSASRLPWSR